jgi:hypothetical protein
MNQSSFRLSLQKAGTIKGLMNIWEEALSHCCMQAAVSGKDLVTVVFLLPPAAMSH